MSEESCLRLCFETLAGFLVATTVLVYPLSANDSGSSINGIYRGTIGRQQIVLEMGEYLPGERSSAFPSGRGGTTIWIGQLSFSPKNMFPKSLPLSR